MFYRILIVFSLLANACVNTHYLSGEVVRVADGDTFTLLVEGQQYRIRLHGVDCPERGQPYNRVATQFTQELLATGEVKVRQMDTDQYGRVVGIVLIDDTINLNERLLKSGLAWHYRTYDRNPRWTELETDAREAKRGLWVEPGAIPPWKWRNRERAERNKHR